MTTEEDIQELAEELEEQGISRKELLKEIGHAIVLGQPSKAADASAGPDKVREFRLSTQHAEEIYIEHDGIEYRVNDTGDGLNLIREGYIDG